MGLHVDFGQGNSFNVSGRGELHARSCLKICAERAMKCRFQPRIIKEEGGVKLEPYEEVTRMLPDMSDCLGTVENQGWRLVQPSAQFPSSRSDHLDRDRYNDTHGLVSAILVCALTTLKIIRPTLWKSHDLRSVHPNANSRSE